MARYTSITGADVVLKFKGIDITIPANGYYESSGEDLAALYPEHVRKIKLDEVIKNLEQRLMPPNVKEAPAPKTKPLVLNSPTEIPLAPIKEVTIRNEIIAETINNIMGTTNDPDLTEFLGMIRDILSTEK